MAYFLGRDVELAITTENNDLGVIVEENASTNELEATLVAFEQGAGTNLYSSAADKVNLFAGPRACIDGNGPWGDLTGSSSLCPDGTTTLVDSEEWNNEPDNMTAVDLSLGVMDEDVAFIGQRNVLKAEVKKENSISITRKKKDAMWDAIYNEARFGIGKGITRPYTNPKTEGLFDGLRAPDFSGCGYRVYLRFKETTDNNLGEVFILRNCYVTEHAVTMSADSTQEETLSLMSYTDPIVMDGNNPTHTSGSNTYVAATLTSEL